MVFQLVRLIISGKLSEALSLIVSIIPLIAGALILMAVLWMMGLAVLTLVAAASHLIN